MEKNYPEATVGALVFNNKGEVLLLRTHKWTGKYALPGGHIEFGETMIDAVKREVKEETNLDIYDIKFFEATDCITPENYYKKKKHFIFLDFIAKTDFNSVKLNDEAESFIWAKPKKALSLPLEPYTEELIKKYIKDKPSNNRFSNG